MSDRLELPEERYSRETMRGIVDKESHRGFPGWEVADRVILEKDYWNAAALDPEVDRKFISDISTEECFMALDLPISYSMEILDIGCGVGRILSWVANPQSVCHGIDISSKMIKTANKRKDALGKTPWVDYSVTDGRTIPFLEDTIDFAYSMLLFQHLEPLTVMGYITEAYRVLKPGGIFRFQFVDGDNSEGPFSNHYELTEMKTWVEDAGLEFVKADKGLCHFQWTWVTARKPKV